jgi:predicted DNA binding CopG/RHH family protein
MTMAKKERQTRDPLPEFQSRQEMAEFWDTHDFTDYMDDFKPVKARVAKQLSEGITIRFDAETLTELREQAKEKGVGPTTLARMWVLERLRGERRASTP